MKAQMIEYIDNYKKKLSFYDTTPEDCNSIFFLLSKENDLKFKFEN